MNMYGWAPSLTYVFEVYVSLFYRPLTSARENFASNILEYRAPSYLPSASVEERMQFIKSAEKSDITLSTPSHNKQVLSLGGKTPFSSALVGA